MSDDDTIPGPSRLDGLRRLLRREIRRGRQAADVTAPVVRRNLKRLIDDAAIPETAKELVRRVVRRTGLSRRERRDVAGELIAHFADGLAAGETAEGLVEAFGDERRAARLIRRAKRRNRPLTWHVTRGLGLMLGGVVLLYAGLAVYFHLGRASPRVDYLAILNEPLRGVAEDERAWPLYREALLGMSARGQNGPDAMRDLVAARPGDEAWPETAAWLATHQKALATARRAAERPALGFVLGPGGSHIDAALWPGQADDIYVPPGHVARDPARAGLLISVLLPHLTELRTVANALGADAVVARQAGDRQRWTDNVAAMLRMAEQFRNDGFLVNQAVGLGIANLALEEIDQALSGTPQMLLDDDLRRLAHQLAGPDVAGDLLNLRGERMIFHDIVQRAYTDDGDGDGRLTPEGLRLLIDVIGTSPRLDPDLRESVTLAGGPASLLLVAPRAEVSRLYDGFMDAQAARFARPLHELDPPTLDREVGALGESAAGRLRYAPVLALLPKLSHVHQLAERHLGHRDGVVAGLALELYKRRNDRYPDSLDALTPDLLPRVPVDRITGDPVRYRLIDGRPVVYSVGADRDDDGGRLETSGIDSNDAERAARWFLAAADRVPDSDWVLFPQPSTHQPPLPRLPATRPADYGGEAVE